MNQYLQKQILWHSLDFQFENSNLIVFTKINYGSKPEIWDIL